MDKTASFPMTRWTQIRRAGATDDDAEIEANRAMASICSQYWYPVYSYARRRGWDHDEAEDEAQIFFQNLLNGDLLRKADPELGKLRTLFLTVFQRQLATSVERKNAQKRGGKIEHLSLDFEDAAERYDTEKPGNEDSAEALFDRAWALATVDQAIERIKKGLKPNAQTELEHLRPFLQINSSGRASTADVAATLGISEAGVRKKVERFRKSMGEAIREQIAESLIDPTPDRITEEVRALRLALG